MSGVSSVERINLHTPRDPFSAPLDPAVFDEAQLPMRVLPMQDGLQWWLDAFDLFKLEPLRWIGAAFVYLILCAVTLLIPFIGPIVQHVLQTVMLGGLLLGCRRAAAGERFEVGDLFLAFERAYFKPLALMALAIMLGFVLFFLVIGIGFGMLGLMFTIGHALTWSDSQNLLLVTICLLITVLAVSAVGMFYWFAPGLVVFHGVGPIDAMRLSFVASLKNIGSMLIFGIISVLLIFLGILTLGLGYLVIGPLAFITIYTSTRAVFGEGQLPGRLPQPLPVASF